MMQQVFYSATRDQHRELDDDTVIKLSVVEPEGAEILMSCQIPDDALGEPVAGDDGSLHYEVRWADVQQFPHTVTAR